MLLLLLKTSVLNKVVLQKRVFDGFPNLCCPERWFGLNRISHPDWVKLCVDPNGRIKLRTKQKCEILSATSLSSIIISLTLSMLCPKLVLLLTDILQSYLSASLSVSASPCLRHSVFYTFTIPKVTWYEPLYNNMISRFPSNADNLHIVMKVVQKVQSLTQKESKRQKCPGNVNPFQFVHWSKHS